MPKSSHFTRTYAKSGDGPDPVDIHVGARLRLRRNLIGMSQEQMGKALGLTFQQIQKYERGSNRMSASRLHQLSKVLSIPVAWFFEELPNSALRRYGFSDNTQETLTDAPAASTETEMMTRKETHDLIRAYYSITDPKQRRKVLDLVKSMAETLGKDKE